ncbi:MAG: hypothetical protein HZB38_15735, partial [Planctomycetes bacterium]|nr:hypothetical protein [Planctomycetota bacterium]
MKALIRTAMDNARGELLIEQAQMYEDVNRFDDARVCYKQVMDKYKETPAAKDAEAAVEKIRTDKKLKQTIEKERAADEARRWLDLGERFEKAEMPELAREQYEKVIKQHAKTEFAKTAKERLEKLPKADKKGDEAKSEKGKDEKTAAADGKKP